MKKPILFAILLSLIVLKLWTYDFCRVCETGQLLNCNICGEIRETEI